MALTCGTKYIINEMDQDYDGPVSSLYEIENILFLLSLTDMRPAKIHSDKWETYNFNLIHISNGIIMFF